MQRALLALPCAHASGGASDVVERRLSAILAADVVGYSRLMANDEAGTHAELKRIRTEVVERKIAEHQGRIVKLTGDGILAEFPSVVSAVACGAELQREVRAQRSRIQFRIGINLGDVIIEENDIYGDGVNVAARLESLAHPGGIAVSQSVREHVGNRLELTFEDRGEQQLKNIENPVRVYDVLLDEEHAGESAQMKSDRPSVAVLPFTNMSGDPEQEYFSDGITEDLITDLSKISGLFVVARHTAFTYKGKAVKVPQVSRDLGVDFVLEGSVRKAGQRVRITGQLINGKDGGHIWAERFDRDLTDIFAIQDEITQAIVEQLKVKLLPQEKQSIAQSPTYNVEAYTYYLRGREFFLRHSRRYYEVARQMFAKAAELDPNYARAYAGLADCNAWLYVTYRLDISVDEILATAAKALALDPNLADAHSARAVALAAARKYAEGNVEFERALALDPNLFHAHFLYARALLMQGKMEGAARMFERASAINPDDYQAPCLLISVYRSLGRERESENAARRGIALAERAMQLNPDDPRPAHLGISALIFLGEHERAREWMNRALAIDPDDPTTLYNVACGYSNLGELDRALDLLQRLIPLGGPGWFDWIEHDSDLDPLRNQPRYAALREMMKDAQTTL